MRLMNFARTAAFAVAALSMVAATSIAQAQTAEQFVPQMVNLEL